MCCRLQALDSVISTLSSILQHYCSTSLLEKKRKRIVTSMTSQERREVEVKQYHALLEVRECAAPLIHVPPSCGVLGFTIIYLDRYSNYLRVSGGRERVTK
jgi:hypothetical protein